MQCANSKTKKSKFISQFLMMTYDVTFAAREFVFVCLYAKLANLTNRSQIQTVNNNGNYYDRLGGD